MFPKMFRFEEQALINRCSCKKSFSLILTVPAKQLARTTQCKQASVFSEGSKK